jgi:hypothetical protein
MEVKKLILDQLETMKLNLQKDNSPITHVSIPKSKKISRGNSMPSLIPAKSRVLSDENQKNVYEFLVPQKIPTNNTNFLS